MMNTSHHDPTPGDPHAVVYDPKVRVSDARSSILPTLEPSPLPIVSGMYVTCPACLRGHRFANPERDLERTRARGQNRRLLAASLLSFALGYALCASKPQETLTAFVNDGVWPHEPHSTIALPDIEYGHMNHTLPVSVKGQDFMNPAMSNPEHGPMTHTRIFGHLAKAVTTAQIFDHSATAGEDPSSSPVEVGSGADHAPPAESQVLSVTLKPWDSSSWDLA